MARLAAYSVEDNYEVHGGDNPEQPKIVVTPCKKGEDDFDIKLTSMPHTPRPPLEDTH